MIFDDKQASLEGMSTLEDKTYFQHEAHIFFHLTAILGTNMDVENLSLC